VSASGLEDTEMPRLTLVDELADGAGHLLDRNMPVHPVLVEQVDRVNPESLQRTVDPPA
jgi:hypothetical protein